MANKFASGVVLGDLSDFIEPSQACVNPLFASEVNREEPAEGAAKVAVDSSVFSGIPDGAQRPDLIRTSGEKTAKVSLTDCLACSGCVTSAETVLITQQSMVEFLLRLRHDRYHLRVVSVSPQARASIAAEFGCSAAEAQRKLTTWLKSLGVDHIFDTTVASDISLLETAEDFVWRHQNRCDRGWEAPPPSVAYSSTRTEIASDDVNSVSVGGRAPTAATTTAAAAAAAASGTPAHSAGSEAGDSAAGHDPEDSEVGCERETAEPAQWRRPVLPLLTSECPGWVCYAEKTQPQALPFVSTAKSPQQVMGEVVKRVVAAQAGVAPAAVYHATVMPCFDKKLEASRRDFYDEVQQADAVDTVLTAGELLQHWEAEKVDFAALEPAPPSAHPLSGFAPGSDGAAMVGSVQHHAGSGGYADFVFRYAAHRLFGAELASPVEFKQGRNPDFAEAKLVVGGKVVLHFALAYGFRNIQTVLRKLKRGKCPYQLVEVMACPRGCLNGGGQIRDQGAEGRIAGEALQRVQAAFEPRAVRSPLESSPARELYDAHFGGGPGSEAALAHLHTRYHAVPKLKNALTIPW